MQDKGITKIRVCDKDSFLSEDNKSFKSIFSCLKSYNALKRDLQKKSWKDKFSIKYDNIHNILSSYKHTVGPIKLWNKMTKLKGNVHEKWKGV